MKSRFAIPSLQGALSDGRVTFGKVKPKQNAKGASFFELTIGKQTPKKTQASTKMDVVQLKVKTIHFLFISY